METKDVIQNKKSMAIVTIRLPEWLILQLDDIREEEGHYSRSDLIRKLLITSLPDATPALREMKEALIEKTARCLARLILEDRFIQRAEKLEIEHTEKQPNGAACSDILTKEQLELFLASRRSHPRFITAMLLLCQLQNLTIDREQLIERIMEYDTDTISRALSALEDRGLK